jgi:hypothetical protein
MNQKQDFSDVLSATIHGENMLSPQDFLKNLQKDKLFKDWVSHNDGVFLSHFFCQIDKDLNSKSNWEVGYYNPTHNKIAVFTQIDNKFIIKPEDEVFKKEMDQVEKLELDKIKLSYDDAGKTFLVELPKLFPNELLGDGFIVLQELGGKALWNFTLITKTMKFVNIKINASSNEVESHQSVELVQK